MRSRSLAPRLLDRPPQADKVDLLLDRIRHAVCAHRVLGDRAIDSAFRFTAEQAGGIDKHDRPRPGSADHGATDRGLGVEKKSSDGVRKFTRLAAVLVVAPAGGRRYPAHFYADKYFVCAE